MKKLLFLAFLCVSPFALTAQTDCQHALQVVPDVVYTATYAAGSQVPSPVCTSGSNNNVTMGIWYTYTPAELHTSTVSTNLAGYPLKDTRVHVYTGDCDNLICIAGDDDSGPNYSSIVSFMAEAGVTYYIAFDNNWNSETFNFELTEGEFIPSMFNPTIVNAGGQYTYCVVDMNGDYLDDIVSVSDGSVHVMYQNSNGGFTPAVLPAVNTSYMPDWSMAAGDYDKNGYNDLLYGNGSGAAIMLANDDGTGFNSKLESTMFVFCQRTNFVDINNDGNLDAFVCHDIAPNVYFLNDGNGGFTFHQGGLGDHASGGNYGSIWVDYDNDGDPDLFIAKCRGGSDPAGINELHRNDGNGVFTTVASENVDEANMASIVQTWSSAWGDFDNDGDMDALIGASSGVNGSHQLMINNGDGTFTNETAGSGFDTFTGMNIEHVAHDFNNDGFIDVFAGDNTIMMNNGDLTFTPVVIPAGHGPIGDLNNDGFLDIVNGNTVYFNSGNDNNWLTVELQGVESNGNGIGARVEIYGAWGEQIRDVRSGDGFRYMSSLNTHFGLGTADAIDQVVIKWPSGTVDHVDNPPINQPLFVEEGSTVLSTPDNQLNAFTLYPNPAKESVKISGNDNTITKAGIYDLAGKHIKTVNVTDNTIPVAFLAKGTYILMLEDAKGMQHSARFIKD